jgi:predicted DNA-binding transcriptional regulator YafY
MMGFVSRLLRVERLRELLRAEDGTTIAALAETLGVTRRTVMRDLAHLREGGAPIEGEPGPGGGVRLSRERGIASVHLSLDEIASLWVAVSLARRGTAVPWSAAARGAMNKLVASLPGERAREVRSLLRRVVIGPPATPPTAASAGPVPEGLLPIVEEGLRRRRAMTFDYRDRHGERSRRLAEPHGLLVQTPVWYLLAHDVDREAPRMFRMDRIARPALVERSFVPDPRVVLVLTEEIRRLDAIAAQPSKA